MRRGAVTVEPAIELGDDEALTPAKANQLAQPTAQVGQHQIGSEELVDDDVRDIVTTMPGRSTVLDRSADHTTAGIYKSSDFVQGQFTDGVGTVASTNFTSLLGLFSAADNGRSIIGTGIPAGTTMTYVNATTITLSQAFAQLFTDGVISGTTTLDSVTAAFTNADTGRTITGDGIPAGTTVTYVSATRVTLSQASTNAVGVNFQISGRQITGVVFLVVGRGAGWRVQVDKDGIGRAEIYVGAISATIATGAFVVRPDGSVSIGTGANKLTIDKDGNFAVGTGVSTIGITKDGKLYVGADSFANAIGSFDGTGNFKLRDVASAAHQIATGAVDPSLAPVIASPSGGAIINPTNVSLNCLTKYSRIYYRLVAQDGVTNGTTTMTSATAAFTFRDIGKPITGTDIPAGTFIQSVTNATTIVLSAAATGSHTGNNFEITPNDTDTLYVTGVPITLTATRRLTARAYKNGEYSALTSALFDTSTGGSTCANPIFSPVPGDYTDGGSTLSVTLSHTNGSSGFIFYTKDGATTPTHDGSFNAGASTFKITGSSGVIVLPTGTTTVKMLAAKSGLSDSGVVSGTYFVSKASGGGGGLHLPEDGGGGGGGGEAFP